MAMPDFIRALRARGFDNREIHKIVYENPLRFMSQSRRFNFNPPIPLAMKCG
jgi:microsomal dipeptidase-like Zn-dependent dipeptidase